MCNHLSEQTRREPDLYEKYLLCQNIREATATVLTMLEDEFCFDTAVPCTESEPMRYGLNKKNSHFLLAPL